MENSPGGSASVTFFVLAHRSVSRGAQPPDFLGCQLPPMPQLQFAVAEGSDGDALQVGDGMADGVAHLAHLTIAPFTDCDLEKSAGVARILYGPRRPTFFTAPGAPPPDALALAFAPARAQGCRAVFVRGGVRPHAI